MRSADRSCRRSRRPPAPSACRSRSRAPGRRRARRRRACAATCRRCPQSTTVGDPTGPVASLEASRPRWQVWRHRVEGTSHPLHTPLQTTANAPGGYRRTMSINEQHEQHEVADSGHELTQQLSSGDLSTSALDPVGGGRPHRRARSPSAGHSLSSASPRLAPSRRSQWPVVAYADRGGDWGLPRAVAATGGASAACS